MSYPLCGAARAFPHGEGSDAMPGTAQATAPLLPDGTGSPFSGSGSSAPLAAAERCFLLHLQRQALYYFLDNQLPCGLMLDRQRNHGPRRAHGLCSIAATGMGFIALALASAPPYRLLTPQAAVRRVRLGLRGV